MQGEAGKQHLRDELNFIYGTLRQATTASERTVATAQLATRCLDPVFRHYLRESKILSKLTTAICGTMAATDASTAQRLAGAAFVNALAEDSLAPILAQQPQLCINFRTVLALEERALSLAEPPKATHSHATGLGDKGEPATNSSEKGSKATAGPGESRTNQTASLLLGRKPERKTVAPAKKSSRPALSVKDQPEAVEGRAENIANAASAMATPATAAHVETVAATTPPEAVDIIDAGSRAALTEALQPVATRIKLPVHVISVCLVGSESVARWSCRSRMLIFFAITLVERCYPQAQVLLLDALASVMTSDACMSAGFGAIAEVWLQRILLRDFCLCLTSDAFSLNLVLLVVKLLQEAMRSSGLLKCLAGKRECRGLYNVPALYLVPDIVG